MSSVLIQLSLNFRIKKKNLAKAHRAVLDNIDPNWKPIDDPCAPSTQFDKVDIKKALKTKTLIGMFEQWHFKAKLNKKGDLDDIYYAIDNGGDESRLFDFIAPYVEEGSTIKFHSEMYRGNIEYTFSKKKVKQSRSHKPRWKAPLHRLRQAELGVKDTLRRLNEQKENLKQAKAEKKQKRIISTERMITNGKANLKKAKDVLKLNQTKFKKHEQEYQSFLLHEKRGEKMWGSLKDIC